MAKRKHLETGVNRPLPASDECFPRGPMMRGFLDNVFEKLKPRRLYGAIVRSRSTGR